jgi:hypothetical protein
LITTNINITYTKQVLNFIKIVAKKKAEVVVNQQWTEHKEEIKIGSLPKGMDCFLIYNKNVAVLP